MNWNFAAWQLLAAPAGLVAEAEEAGWIFRKLLDPASIPTLAIILGCSIGALAVIGHYVTEAIKTRSLNQLKHRMLDQGLSPEDIERVLQAGSSSASDQES